GQDLALEEGVDAAFFGQWYLFGVAQVAVGFIFDHVADVAVSFQIRAVVTGFEELTLLELAAFGDDGWRGVVAPADGLVEGFPVRAGQLDAGLLEFAFASLA